ncbi:MAG: helix-turn-helix domain-containing protein [Candidatus Hydrothermarchaeota archaeon]
MGAKEELSNRVAGEIVLSNSPSRTIKKWREVFDVSQMGLARELEVSASVVSDYESGRRKSPGARMVRKIVEALIRRDEHQGSKVLRAYERAARGTVATGAILDLREFHSPMRASEFCRIVKGEVVANGELLEKEIYGYTAIDGPKAILEFTHQDFISIYGLTSERALIFTKVSGGRSPLVAIRVSSMKPGLVVLHGPKAMDPLGVKIAEREKIPVILSRLESVEELIKELRAKTP